MSLIHEGKLSTSFAYSKVEAVADFGVDALVRNHSPGLASQGSSNASTTHRQTRRNIDRSELCFITKRPSYTLGRAHWVNAVRNDSDIKANVERHLLDLGIVHDSFNLNDTSNLTNLDRMLHVSLDKYGLFAVTASLMTLRAIICLVEEQNRIWQEKFDRGTRYIREFDACLPIFDRYTTTDLLTQLEQSPFSDAQYELVVLHPEHFLPKGSSLTLYTLVNDQPYAKDYVVGHDRTLREIPGTTDSPRYPAFTHVKRATSLSLNVFLVILNAEIKFRRYRRMGAMPQLPEDVEKLMDETIKLVHMIYWKPEKRTSYRERVDLSLPDIDVESSERVQVVRPVKRRGENATLEQRVEYNQYLLSGRDFELNADDFWRSLDITPTLSPIVPGSDTDTLDPIHIATKVAQWQQTNDVK